MAVKSGPGAFWLGALRLGKFWSGKAVKSRRGRARSVPLGYGTARRSGCVGVGLGRVWRSSFGETVLLGHGLVGQGGHGVNW